MAVLGVTVVLLAGYGVHGVENQVDGQDSLLGFVPIEDVVDAGVQAALSSRKFCDSLILLLKM